MRLSLSLTVVSTVPRATSRHSYSYSARAKGRATQPPSRTKIRLQKIRTSSSLTYRVRCRQVAPAHKQSTSWPVPVRKDRTAKPLDSYDRT